MILDNKRIDERGKGEKRLVREQGRDEANEPHIIREAKRRIGDGTPCVGCAGAAFYVPTRKRVQGVESGASSVRIRTQAFDQDTGGMIGTTCCEIKNWAQTHPDKSRWPRLALWHCPMIGHPKHATHEST